MTNFWNSSNNYKDLSSSIELWLFFKKKVQSLWKSFSRERKSNFAIKNPIPDSNDVSYFGGKWEGFVVSKFKAYLILYRHGASRSLKVLETDKPCERFATIYSFFPSDLLSWFPQKFRSWLSTFRFFSAL